MPALTPGQREIDPDLQPLWKRTINLKWEPPEWPADKEKERQIRITGAKKVRGTHRNPNSAACYSVLFLAGLNRYVGRFWATEHAARWTDMLKLKFWKYRKRGGLSEPDDSAFFFSKAQAEIDLAKPHLAEVVSEAIPIFQLKNWLILPSHKTAKRAPSVTGQDVRNAVDELKTLINVVGGDLHALKQHTASEFEAIRKHQDMILQCLNILAGKLISILDPNKPNNEP